MINKGCIVGYQYTLCKYVYFQCEYFFLLSHSNIVFYYLVFLPSVKLDFRCSVILLCLKSPCFLGGFSFSFLFSGTMHPKAWRAWRIRGFLGRMRCRGRVEQVAWPQECAFTSSPATVSNTSWLHNSCPRSKECPWSSSASGISICLLFAQCEFVLLLQIIVVYL